MNLLVLDQQKRKNNITSSLKLKEKILNYINIL